MKEKYLLRDLKQNTELLILAEYIRNPSVKRKEIAERLDVTEQAVSQYISNLEKEQLLAESNGHAKPTRKGVQLLQEKFLQLNHEIENILHQIRVIDTCIALAGAAIKEKEDVGLVMKKGRLIAYPGKKASSKGIALMNSNEGEEVLIGNLIGVVELELGEMLAIQIPSESRGGSKMMNQQIAKKAINDFVFDEITAGDLIGEVALKRIGLKPSILHAPMESTINALSKGLDVLFVGTRESVDRVLAAIEDLKKRTGYSIGFRLIDVTRKQ